jgi:hypothetical protein
MIMREKLMVVICTIRSMAQFSMSQFARARFHTSPSAVSRTARAAIIPSHASPRSSFRLRTHWVLTQVASRGSSVQP